MFVYVLGFVNQEMLFLLLRPASILPSLFDFSGVDVVYVFALLGRFCLMLGMMLT